MNYLDTGNFVLIADLPPDLPASLIGQLKTNFRSDSSSYLADLHPDDIYQWAVNYFGEVLDYHFRYTIDQFPVARFMESGSQGSFLVATNDPISAKKVLSTTLWKDLHWNKKSDVSHCLLITSKYVVVTSYPAVLSIGEIRHMAVAGTTIVKSLFLKVRKTKR